MNDVNEILKAGMNVIANLYTIEKLLEHYRMDRTEFFCFSTVSFEKVLHHSTLKVRCKNSHF